LCLKRLLIAVLLSGKQTYSGSEDAKRARSQLVFDWPILAWEDQEKGASGCAVAKFPRSPLIITL
jgi:hypothetical protein